MYELLILKLWAFMGLTVKLEPCLSVSYWYFEPLSPSSFVQGLIHEQCSLLEHLKKACTFPSLKEFRANSF